MEVKDHWVFYLKLSPNLSSEYLHIATEFQAQGKKMIPVGINTLLECIRHRNKIDLVIIVRTMEELNRFHGKCKKILKLLIRTGRMNMYVASSFSSVNDPKLMRKDAYHFVKLPVRIDFFCNLVTSSLKRKKERPQLWPGGVRGNYQFGGEA